MIIEMCSYSKIEAVPSQNANDTVRMYANDLSLNDSVYVYILTNDIEHPDIVYAQALLETGNFNSSIFKSNNNLFGMKLPKVRETTAIGENKNHAVFDSWMSSIDDYKLWQQTYASNKSRDEYFSYLSKCYSQDEEYASKLKKIISREICNFISE